MPFPLSSLLSLPLVVNQWLATLFLSSYARGAQFGLGQPYMGRRVFSLPTCFPNLKQSGCEVDSPMGQTVLPTHQVTKMVCVGEAETSSVFVRQSCSGLGTPHEATENSHLAPDSSTGWEPLRVDSSS